MGSSLGPAGSSCFIQIWAMKTKQSLPGNRKSPDGKGRRDSCFLRGRYG